MLHEGQIYVKKRKEKNNVKEWEMKIVEKKYRYRKKGWLEEVKERKEEEEEEEGWVGGWVGGGSVGRIQIAIHHRLLSYQCSGPLGAATKKRRLMK